MEAPLHPTKVPAGGGAGAGFQLPSRLSSMFGPLALGCVWRARAQVEARSSSPHIFPLLPNLPTYLIIPFGFFWCWTCALKEASWTDPTISKLTYLSDPNIPSPPGVLRPPATLH